MRAKNRFYAIQFQKILIGFIENECIYQHHNKSFYEQLHIIKGFAVLF